MVTKSEPATKKLMYLRVIHNSYDDCISYLFEMLWRNQLLQDIFASNNKNKITQTSKYLLCLYKLNVSKYDHWQAKIFLPSFPKLPVDFYLEFKPLAVKGPILFIIVSNAI